MEEYKDSKAAFQAGKAAIAATTSEPMVRRFQTWIRKCDAELDSTFHSLVCS